MKAVGHPDYRHQLLKIRKHLSSHPDQSLSKAWVPSLIVQKSVIFLAVRFDNSFTQSYWMLPSIPQSECSRPLFYYHPYWSSLIHSRAHSWEKPEEFFSSSLSSSECMHARLCACLETLHLTEISLSVDFHPLACVLSSQRELFNFLVHTAALQILWDSRYVLLSPSHIKHYHLVQLVQWKERC